MRNMTETVLKLMLLRYNMLSKEKAAATSKCMHTGEDDEWEECVDEMTKMEDDLRKDEYRFVCTDYEFVRTSSKAAGETRYNIYTLVPTNKYDSIGNA